MNTIAELERDFRPGYRLTQNSGMYHIRDPKGNLVRTERGAPVALPVSGEAGYHQVRRYRSVLTERGVIKAPTRRKAKERHIPKKANHSENPLVVAKTVLQSPSSSGKERTMAKEVLRLYEQNDKLRELVRIVGRRNSELENQMETRSDV